MGRPLARKSDEAVCDLHGPTVIDEGASKFPDRDRKLLELHDYRCASRCRISKAASSCTSRARARTCLWTPRPAR
jgi:hypothetical protein